MQSVRPRAESSPSRGASRRRRSVRDDEDDASASRAEPQDRFDSTLLRASSLPSSARLPALTRGVNPSPRRTQAMMHATSAASTAVAAKSARARRSVPATRPSIRPSPPRRKPRDRSTTDLFSSVSSSSTPPVIPLTRPPPSPPKTPLAIAAPRSSTAAPRWRRARTPRGRAAPSATDPPS